MRKILFAFAILVFFSSVVLAQKAQYRPAIVGFYNLENFYDTVNNPLVDDEEFLPNSERHYNGHIFLDKVGRLSTVMSQLGTDINPDGFALLDVSEVENDTVLASLVNHINLKSRNH